MLYACETWTLRTDQQRRLRVLQRKMLRMILNAKKRVMPPGSSSESDPDSEASQTGNLDSWQSFLKRTAQWTQEQLEKAGLQQWTEKWRSKKWQWASKLLCDTNNKWSAVATEWQPLIHSRYLCGRRQARPKRRWEQDFLDYLGDSISGETTHWIELARNPEWWLAHTEKFAKYSP